MSNDLNQLLETALNKANSTGDLDDINKAAGVAKAIAETSKAKADISNARSQMRLEGLKSLATFLVPIVSLLTITVTVYIQFLQLQETQRQNEATQWRDFLASAKISPNTVQSDPTFAPRLRSFFDSPNYRNQALSISKRVMGGIANLAAFKDLFGVTFPTVDSSTIIDVVDVGRSLFQNLDTIYSDCAKFTDQLDDTIKAKLPKIGKAAGICASVASEKAIRELGFSSAELEKLSELRRNVLSLEAENTFLSGELGAFLRNNYLWRSLGSSAPKPLSLSKLWIVATDLSNVDFTEVDLTDTILDNVRLDGAKLVPKKFGGTLDIRFAAWWDARSVDQDALNTLIDEVYPYYVEYETFANNQIVERDYYVAQIARLCVPMKESCSNEHLKFGKRENSSSGQSQAQ